MYHRYKEAKVRLSPAESADRTPGPRKPGFYLIEEDVAATDSRRTLSGMRLRRPTDSDTKPDRNVCSCELLLAAGGEARTNTPNGNVFPVEPLSHVSAIGDAVRCEHPSRVRVRWQIFIGTPFPLPFRFRSGLPTF